MLLTAMLDGKRVDATTYTAEAWSELQGSADRTRMVMPLCRIRAVAKTRGPSTRYFAHYRKTGCKVEHGGETPQHLAVKEALKVCIDQVPGWHAIVEHPHPSREWKLSPSATKPSLPPKETPGAVSRRPGTRSRQQSSTGNSHRRTRRSRC